MPRMAIALVVLALLLPSGALAEMPDAPSATAAAVRASAVKFAASQKNATVMLKDGNKLSGTVVSANDAGFVVADRKTRQNRTLAYDQVSEVKRKGLHPAAKVAIAAGAGVLGAMTFLALAITD